MIKKILLVLSTCLIFCGCKHESEYFETYSNTNQTSLRSGFNEEHYIWENWSFSTNRVDK